MNPIFPNFQDHFHKYLSPTQYQTLSILIGLLNQYKQVKIETLATHFPLPILFESRRKHQLLRKYHIIIIGDIEWNSIELATWLKREKNKGKQKIDFAFRQKQDTFFHKGGHKYQKLSEIEIKKGLKQIKMGIKTTKKKGFSRNNLGIYHRKNWNNKVYKEPWYILTSLNSVESVMKIYATRSGIEAMFKDCKTGGYNLEGTKAKKERLINIILLIAIAYTIRALQGEILKKKAKQKYIARPEEKRRKTKRHSEFWLGLYGEIWCNNYDNYESEIKMIMSLNMNKISHYQRGLKAMGEIKKVYQ